MSRLEKVLVWIALSVALWAAIALVLRHPLATG